MLEKNGREGQSDQANKNIADIQIVSSLEKIFPYEKPLLNIKKASMLKNERSHFQIVVKANEHVMDGEIRVESEIADYIKVFSQDYVAVTSEISRWPAYDDYRIRNEREMGIYPDILRPLDKYKHVFKKNVYTPFWVTVDVNNHINAGMYPVRFSAFDEKGNKLAETVFDIEIIDECLEKSDLYVFDWIHFDSICAIHKTKYLSKRFYKIAREYLQTAVKNGVNVLLLPALNYAVDTDEGTYRKDMQLLDIFKTENGYEFDFSVLEEFIDFSLGCGMTYFCLSHIASQWGAKFAVRVRMIENGKKVYKFGWDTPSSSEEYVAFLKAYLSAISSFLEKKGLKEKSFICVSDEPPKSGMEDYQRLSNLIKKYAKGLPVLDATTEYSYVEQGKMDVPVVVSEKYDGFPETQNAWVYYCCVQRAGYVSNRFINMPSQRNRILGIQLYANQTKGFLHWGYNFYAGYLSRQFINPYLVNDSMGMFEAGDAFIVYPTENGCIESLRQPVFYDGLQDYRALKTLEKYIGKERVLQLLRDEGVQGYKTYPRSAVWHIAFREKINRMIAEEACKKNTRLANVSTESALTL